MAKRRKSGPKRRPSGRPSSIGPIYRSTPEKEEWNHWSHKTMAKQTRSLASDRRTSRPGFMREKKRHGEQFSLLVISLAAITLLLVFVALVLFAVYGDVPRARELLFAALLTAFALLVRGLVVLMKKLL
jgi:hypothetical protein